MSRIHPTVLISPEADIAEGVQIGPYTVIEGAVRIGPGCVIGPHVHLIGPLTLGRGNQIGTGCVLGARPQHLQYNDEPTCTLVGDFNIFREHVTIHRGSHLGLQTVIGNHNFLMAHAHIGHDAQIGNHCILANGALVAGHCVLEDRVFISGNAATHQWVRVGRLALLSGCSGTTKDIPPFIMQQSIDRVVGVNVIGMRRAGIANEQIDAVRRAFHILYRKGFTVRSALDKMLAELGEYATVREMVQFIRASKRGICGGHRSDPRGDSLMAA